MAWESIIEFAKTNAQDVRGPSQDGDFVEQTELSVPKTDEKSILIVLASAAGPTFQA